MAHENSTVIGFAVDNTVGALVSISGSVNSVSFDGGLELLDDTGMGDTNRTVIAGIGNARNVTVNGFLNSTTRTIFGKLAANATSITKTIELKMAASSFYRGEAWPEAVSLSASPGTINTWSCTFRAQSGLTNYTTTAVT